MNKEKDNKQSGSQFGAGNQGSRQAGQQDQQAGRTQGNQNQTSHRQDEDIDSEEETGSQGVQPRSDKAGQQTTPNRSQR